MVACRPVIVSRFSTFALALIAAGLSDAAVCAQNTFPMSGTIRDFHRTDPAIAVVPVGGNGHYAGNIALNLSTEDRPVFVGGGHKVLTQWRDKDGHLIAPHMLLDSAAGGTVLMMEMPLLHNISVVDTFDPSLGAYGPGNVGPAPTFIVDSVMPGMEMPADPGPEDCEVKYSGKGVTTIGEDIHCRAFEVSNKHVVRIDAPVTIVCDMFEVKNRARISVLEGGSLTVYVRERGRIENHSEVNMNSADSSRVTIYNLSCHEFEVQNSSEMYARLVSPSAPVRLKNHAHLYGQFTGESACLSNRSGMHIEQGVTICGAVPEDIFGVYGVASSGGIPSAAALDTWFIDAPGQNFAISHTITLTRSATNPIWQFNSSSFYPIENKGFGKEAQLHNFYFTFAATLRFRHHACSGGFVDFSGNDDAWLFINGELAMDRGGIQPGGVAQYVEIDRMGLQDGQTYDMHFFYVQRSTLMSNFRLRTNLELIAE